MDLHIGDAATLVGWGTQVHILLEVADLVQEELGASCEVIDLISILPWDTELVCKVIFHHNNLLRFLFLFISSLFFLPLRFLFYSFSLFSPPFSFSFSLLFSSLFISVFNATGSFACITFKSTTVTFARLLRGFVSFIEMRGEEGRGKIRNTQYFNRTIRLWKAVLIGNLYVFLNFFVPLL